MTTRCRYNLSTLFADLPLLDVGIVTAAAREVGREVGVAMPLGAVVAQLTGALLAQRNGSVDHSAWLLLVKELSGRAAAEPTVS